jgi:hypoxanthine phosphoribosyltransferase
MDAIKNYKYEISIKNNFTGNEALLLDQIKKTGKTLDYALLYGKKNEKVLIGFQIKCYFNNSILAEQTIDKSTIREKCSKMLVNSMILFNCKITNWNYILIFFINNEEKNENINLKNLEKCKNK